MTSSMVLHGAFSASALVMVVAKFGSSPSAAASSLSVSSAPGELSTSAAMAASIAALVKAVLAACFGRTGEFRRVDKSPQQQLRLEPFGPVAQLLGLQVVDAILTAQHRVVCLQLVDAFFPLFQFNQVRHVVFPLLKIG
jgi:hypothetical protein